MHKGSTEWPRLVRFTIIVCVLAGSLMLIVGCGSTTGTSGGASAEVIKVGMLWPLTGDLAKLGQDCRNACVLAADQINQAGGIKSMGGAKIELVSADTQSKPDVGLGECRRLIEQENVSVITGTYQSSLALPATEICERGKCPILLGIAAADEVTERGLKYTFRAGTTTTLYGQNQVDLALALPDLVEGGYSSPKKFALLYEDSDFGQAIAVATKEYLAEKGLSLVADVSYSASSVDLTTQVAKVKAANPDVVLTTTYLNDAVLLVKARKKLGMKQYFIDSSGGTSVASFAEGLGADADGQLYVGDFVPTLNVPGVKEVNAAYKARFGVDMVGQAQAYQAMIMLGKALEIAGSADRDTIRDALEKTVLRRADGDTIILAMDVMQFDDTHQVPTVSVGIQWQSGKTVPVYPAEYSAAKVRPWD